MTCLKTLGSLKPRPNVRNMSQHCWVQHVSFVWPPSCDILSAVGSSLKMVKLEPTTPNMSQLVATGWPNARNMLHPTMLRLFGGGLKKTTTDYYGVFSTSTSNFPGQIQSTIIELWKNLKYHLSKMLPRPCSPSPPPPQPLSWGWVMGSQDLGEPNAMQCEPFSRALTVLNSSIECMCQCLCCDFCRSTTRSRWAQWRQTVTFTSLESAKI